MIGEEKNNKKIMVFVSSTILIIIIGIRIFNYTDTDTDKSRVDKYNKAREFVAHYYNDLKAQSLDLQSIQNRSDEQQQQLEEVNIELNSMRTLVTNANADGTGLDYEDAIYELERRIKYTKQ